MKYIKWFSTLLGLLVMLVIIILIGLPLITFSSEGYSVFKKFWLFIVLILSASFAIYPKTKYDSWLQRFLGGITLVSFPLLFMSISLLRKRWLLWGLAVIFLGATAIFLYFFLKKKTRILNDKRSKIFKYILLLLFMCIPFLHTSLIFPLLAILLGATTIFLCFFLKKKAKIDDERTNKIFRNFLLFPFGVGIFSPLSTFLFFRVIGPFIFLMPLLTLTIGIPAVINGGRVKMGQLLLAYVGITLANLSLLMQYWVILYYGFVGE